MILVPKEVCIDLKLTTMDYGEEISWKFGSCATHADMWYQDHSVYEIECCQPAGDYEFECLDEDGDGWNGAYMEIGGTKVCQDFDDGYVQKQIVAHSAST